MKIGIIGAGMIGATAARAFAAARHTVTLSNSRGPASLAPLVAELGAGAQAMTVEEAARWADVLLLAVPWRRPEALPSAGAVAGKIVVDAMNPYAADGAVIDLGERTSSEHTQERLPQARLVKAFNTVWFRHLAENARISADIADRHAIFVAGDDQAAKRVVIGLIEDIGFGGGDTGSLIAGGRRQQPNMTLYNRVMTVAEAQKAVDGSGS